jgi:hypothetical protein
VRSPSRSPGQPGGLSAGRASRVRTRQTELAARLGATPAASDVPAQAAAPGPKPSPAGRHVEHIPQPGAITRTRPVDDSVRPRGVPRGDLDATDDLWVA